MTLAAAAAIAAAAAVSVVALAFALYQVVMPFWGAAGAAAAVAGVAALIVALAGVLAASKAGAGHRHHAAPVEAGLVDKILEIVRDRPILSAGAALAAGVFALRNPAFLSALVKGFMDSQPPKR